MAGYTTKYTGGNATLDAALAKQSATYNAARKKALAGDQSAVTAMREANDAANQLRNQYGYAAEYANGDIENVKKQIGYTGSSAGKKTSSAASGSAGRPSGATTPSYADLLKEQQNAYDKIQAQQEAAKKAAVEQAVGTLDTQKKNVNQSYTDLNRQLYINRRMAEKNLPQKMAAMGHTGGLTESSMLGLQTNYNESLRQGEQERAKAISDLDKAIVDTRLQGDISIAELAAQNAKDKLTSYANILTAMQNQANADREYALTQQQMTRQEALDQLERDDLDYSRKLAAAQYLYESAGDASGLRMLGFDDGQIAALQKQWAVDKQKTVSSGGGSDTGKPVLTYSQMMEAINAGDLTPNVLSAYEYFMGEPYRVEESVAEPVGSGWVDTEDHLLDMAGIHYPVLENRIREMLEAGQAQQAVAELQKYERYLNKNQYSSMLNLVNAYGLGN